MFALLKFIFIILLFAVLVVLVFGATIVGYLISLFRKPAGRSETSNGTGPKQQDAYQQTTSQPQQKKKIIPDDEGEYVDFEEVE